MWAQRRGPKRGHGAAELAPRWPAGEAGKSILGGREARANESPGPRETGIAALQARARPLEASVYRESSFRVGAEATKGAG